ncbi:hypothetical protein [Croceivirga sp. JEA036]|uniref:hypothetical protein n=1 Tax=Croceivirga sp. JEA036 TaxID=2721162 RepID=UPI0014396023|nr:hypothetical protein [Croceivirga sp. JEA036]NJB38196.1 hypothetical protein [Croceivirga sp. JEA036]
MLYKIQPALINKIVGWVASNHMIEEYNPNPDDSIVNLKCRGKLEFTPDFNAIKILNRAKPMDIITSVPITSSGLILSEKLLKIILKHTIPIETQIFEALAIHKNKTYNYNYFYVYEPSDYRLIDWNNSLFVRKKMEEILKMENKIYNELEYQSLQSNLEPMQQIVPSKLALAKEFILSDILRLHNSWHGYYVTEALKNEIEKSDCQGVDLIPIDQLGFEVEFI